ncbi:MAG: energy transducer TonB [Bacteroidia bacterium]
MKRILVFITFATLFSMLFAQREDTGKEIYPCPNTFVFVEAQPKPLNLDTVWKNIRYLPLLREACVEGTVMFRVLIDENGRYVKHIIIKSAHPLLQEMYEKWVPYLRFSPAIQNGKPIKFWVNVPFRLCLR